MKQSKKTKAILLVLAGLVCLGAVWYGMYGCQSEVDVSESLKRDYSAGSLCLKNLSVGKDWNRMLILGPYDDVDRYELEVSRADRNGIKSFSMFDTYCIIVFLQGNEAVAYAPVSRDIFDFAPIEGKFYDKDYVFITRLRDYS